MNKDALTFQEIILALQNYWASQGCVVLQPYDSEVGAVPVEITYGLERLAMYIQGVDSVYDLVWARSADGSVFTYGDVYLENEREFSTYNFELADVDLMRRKFDEYEAECHHCLEAGQPLPAYDCVLKC